MRVPFPHALSIGTDIIAHSRIFRTIQKSQPDPQRLITRILHPAEITSLTNRFPDWRKVPSDQQELSKLSIYLAGRWAAKEAAKKAWGAHLLSFRDLRIEQQSHGDVEVVCQSFDESDARDLDNQRVEQVAKLSISHDGEYAVATVIASPLHVDIVRVLEARKVSIEREVVDMDTAEKSISLGASMRSQASSPSSIQDQRMLLSTAQ